MLDNPRPTSLNAILANARERVTALRVRAAELERAAADGPTVRPFPGDVGRTVGLIAEVKRRSPSQGAIRADLDPVGHARAYVRGGALAVSVLTDEKHFGGTLEDLSRVAAAVSVPVLRKDFILDELQIMEARAAGASAVLLIARAVSPDQLHSLAAAARTWGLATLVEVHAEAELEAALATRPNVLGVNARDLSTFALDMRGAEQIVSRVPRGVTVVAESGVERRADVERLALAGADLVLVGTSVARSDDPEQTVRALVGVRRETGARR
ncbi:MAG TPA: indole-3-glycerol phosphate synthase TrpC [Gemmatimonadales bacterium]|nr:indole-3-glycerol phosphate synthase TrpC [Gemmatimonadales bacterium]